MKKLVLYFALVFIVCSLVLVFPAAAAVNGKIAFSSDRDGNKEIYVMNPDGTQQTRLTNNGIDDWHPAWSPDSKKIAFGENFLARTGEYPDIYVMNADKTGQTRLTTNPDIDNDPAWSPDGKKIAFYSWRDPNTHDDIYVMNADGTNQIRLTNNPAEDIEPAWSPDSKKIAFQSDRHGKFDIYVMNADGSDATNPTRLTNSQGSSTHPAWSPDGKKIAFVRWNEIYVMNADGTGQTWLTYHPAIDENPTWSPDGKKIAFQSDRNGKFDIYVMNSDGSDATNPIRLTINAADDESPAWGPAIDSITIKFPNGGETWQRGTPHTVTWSYTGNPGSTVKIVLLKGGVEVGTIAANAPIGSNGKGSYTWAMNPSGTTGSDYKVSVQGTSRPTIIDTSDNSFTITAAGTTPSSITVTSPNGGESWKRGTPHTISWKYTGNPGPYVKIELLKGGVVVGTATYSTSLGTGGIGSYPWSISSSRAPGTNYRIRVTSVSQPTISDTSNGDFTITA